MKKKNSCSCFINFHKAIFWLWSCFVHMEDLQGRVFTSIAVKSSKPQQIFFSQPYRYKTEQKKFNIKQKPIKFNSPRIGASAILRLSFSMAFFIRVTFDLWILFKKLYFGLSMIVATSLLLSCLFLLNPYTYWTSLFLDTMWRFMLF